MTCYTKCYTPCPIPLLFASLQVLLHQFMGYVFINFPLHITLAIYPNWLPFHLHVTSSFFQLPLDLLLLQLVFPHVLAHVQVDAIAIQATRLWL